MATPIKDTPVLTGEDSMRFELATENPEPASIEEMLRIRAATDSVRLASNRITIPCQTDNLGLIPTYVYAGDAGADLCAALAHLLILYPGERKIIPTGLRAAIPHGYEMQIRSRSSFALRGIVVANSPATIDAGYRAEIGVILANIGDAPFTVEPGMRIAQAVIAPVMRATFVIVDRLPDSARGDGGFGSTGE